MTAEERAQERAEQQRMSDLASAVSAARAAVRALPDRREARSAEQEAHRRHVLAHQREVEQAAADAGVMVCGPC